MTSGEEQHAMKDARGRQVFAVPGRGETVDEAFGAWNADVAVEGVDFGEAFVGLTFSAQVEVVAEEVRRGYWNERALVVGRSFGAWIVLHALMREETVYPGTVVLIASVFGYGRQGETRFMAPGASRFWTEAAARNGPPARTLAVLHGRRDTQCPFAYAEHLGALWNVEVRAFEAGHELGKETFRDEVAAAVREVWRG